MRVWWTLKVELAEDRNISRIVWSGVDLGSIGHRALGVVSLLKNRTGQKKKTANQRAHKRWLPSSTALIEQFKKRSRRTEENIGQVPAGGSRPGTEEERPLQSSRIELGRSSPCHLRSIKEMTRKACSQSSGRLVQPQEGPVRSRREQFRRSSPYHFRHHRQSGQGCREPEESLRSRRCDPRAQHSGTQRVNPEFRFGSHFRIILEQYFSGVEHVLEFLENMDNNLKYYEIPTQLACAYLKGHLTGRALYWFEVLGYRVVEDKATDYAHLKQALSEQFPRERSEFRVGNPEIYNQTRPIVSLTGIDKKIGGKREVTIDMPTIVDHGESSIDLRIKGLISDQPGLTHVLYHEIDTGDKGPVVSRPYRYDRRKQGIIYYEIEKMLRDGTIRPIQSPYVSPIVLTRKNNGLPPDSPEAYRFAIDYRKLNAITK
ncbi:uncharacterized protein TNCV_174791 [Trichonephila clavipes]|nr:uncharacterized protein TNCV_174791 [Trichonephila clavipes]